MKSKSTHTDKQIDKKWITKTNKITTKQRLKTKE